MSKRLVDGVDEKLADKIGSGIKCGMYIHYCGGVM